MEACVEALKIDLPQDLMDKVDVIHEEFRSPTQYYSKKETIANAPWLKQ